jgi:hypothetical protein
LRLRLMEAAPAARARTARSTPPARKRRHPRLSPLALLRVLARSQLGRRQLAAANESPAEGERRQAPRGRRSGWPPRPRELTRGRAPSASARSRRSRSRSRRRMKSGAALQLRRVRVVTPRAVATSTRQAVERAAHLRRRYPVPAPVRAAGGELPAELVRNRAGILPLLVGGDRCELQLDGRADLQFPQPLVRVGGDADPRQAEPAPDQAEGGVAQARWWLHFRFHTWMYFPKPSGAKVRQRLLLPADGYAETGWLHGFSLPLLWPLPRGPRSGFITRLQPPLAALPRCRSAARRDAWATSHRTGQSPVETARVGSAPVGWPRLKYRSRTVSPGC